MVCLARSKWSSHRTSALLVGVWLAACAARAEVVIEGVEDDIRDNVLAVMRLDDEACETPRRRVEQSFEAATPQIHTALEAYGYYAAQIDRALRFDESCWVAEFRITLGEVVRFRRVEVDITGEASTDPAFSRLLQVNAITPGEPLVHSRYETLKSSLSSLALERGYIDATFGESRIDVFPSELAADVKLALASGIRYRFGEIILEQSVLHDEFVEGFLQFKTGDYYDSRLLVQSRVDLFDSGYFNGIDIRPLAADAAQRTVPISIQLTPAPKRHIGYGLGFSTDTGPRVRFTRNIRRFNESGHQLNFNALLSPVVSEVVTNYRMPYGDPRTEWVSFDAGIKREDTETSESESLQLSARRVLQERFGLTRTPYLSLVIEDFQVGDQTGRARLLMPGMEWSRLNADSALRPRRGSRLIFEMRGAGDSLGSNTSFAQLIARGKWIWGLPRQSRLLIRGDLGRTWTDTIDELPPSVRFFAGGDNSVRGYEFETLGPTDENGEVIGGTRLLTMSVEIEYPVKRAWSVAAFADAGNAFDSSLDLQRGIGIGARWQSPLGPIRIDVAKPQDGPNRDLRLHISLGPDL